MVLHEGTMPTYVSPWVAVDAERILSLQAYDVLRWTWESKWHGKIDTRPSPRAISRNSSSTSKSSEGRPTTVFWRRAPLLRKMRSMIVRWQDSRRGVFYTKSGPCEDFADWPIPPYPEDYNWDDEI
ncbi:hypothetical protein BSKO_08796 [Bryopsis sp. KO-2023]|nr:hypothetical protein BSKO_08796 [Bryopsis sp. KO-2023]